MSLAACSKDIVVTREVEVTRVVTATPVKPQAAAPRELTALVGSGRDTEAIQAFLPSMLKVRANGPSRGSLDTHGSQQRSSH